MINKFIEKESIAIVGMIVFLFFATHPVSAQETDSIHVASDPSKGVFFGSDLQLWSDGFGSITMQGYNRPDNNKPSQTSLHLQVPNSIYLPEDTLTEVVLQRTPDQQINYGRWSFSALGSRSNNVSGIFGQFGGNVLPTEFIFNVAYEGPNGTLKDVEAMRIMAGTDLGNVAFGLRAQRPRNVIQLVPGPVEAGMRDSHAILWRGLYYDGGVLKSADWKAYVKVANAQGDSSYVIENSNNGGAPSAKLAISANGGLSLKSENKPAVLEMLGLGGACLKIRDTDSVGWTYCKTQGGALTCSINSCEQPSAGTDTNVALSSAGAVATASSTFNDPQYPHLNFSVSSAIDNIHTGANWETAEVGMIILQNNSPIF